MHSSKAYNEIVQILCVKIPDIICKAVDHPNTVVRFFFFGHDPLYIGLRIEASAIVSQAKDGRSQDSFADRGAGV